MPSFGEDSKAKLATAHKYLQILFNEVIKDYDCKIICGERNKEDQDKAVAEGKSKTPYPTSKHNRIPSLAVDVVPYPIDWSDLRRFYHFGGFVTKTAKAMNIPIRWGGDWNGNMDFKDQNFHDLPHFEVVLEGMKD